MPRVFTVRLFGTLLGGLLALAQAANVWGCENQTFRDAAFREPRDVHRLCVMSAGDHPDGQRTVERLSAWLEGPGEGFNAEVHHAKVDDPSVRWRDYGIPSAPPTSPAVVLAGFRTLERKAFFIDHWEPGPSEDDLQTLLTSPVREAVKRALPNRLGVVLYALGTDTTKGVAESVIETVLGDWEKTGPMGASMVRLDRSDARERLLLSFLGLKDSGPEWLTVVFGRGKVMDPLVGQAITKASLSERLATLAADCTCLQSGSSVGVDIPMAWNADLNAAFVPTKGVPEDPIAAIRASGGSGMTMAFGVNWLFVVVVCTAFGLFVVVALASVLIVRMRRAS